MCVGSRTLDISRNKLTGTMPGMISQHFTKLTYLDVGGNSFENGDLDVSRLRLLTTLGMYETKMNGSVPEGIGTLTSLT